MGLKVLVVGGGGREHALCRALSDSPEVDRVYCAPGNAGISKEYECVGIRAEDVDGLARWASRNAVDLTVVGPEAPLIAGIADRFRGEGLVVFGPTGDAAMIEGSKAFAKELMDECGVPTARHRVFRSPVQASEYVRKHGAPVVVKADGLAAGKGVYVCGTVEEASRAIEEIMVMRVFGEAGSRVVIEEFLEGPEVSMMAFVDGEDVLLMEPAQDHKRAYDGDRGPNTGGMGSYSPVPFVTAEIQRRIRDEVFLPVVKGLAKRGIRYTGMLYAGLMLTSSGPMVLEFNARFGDPETQVVLPRLKTSLAKVVTAAVEGRLASIGGLEWDRRAAVCVVMASKGYPGAYEKGKPISGLDEVAAMQDVRVFHAGTSIGAGGAVVTSGGRVLGVTALGEDVRSAADRAYEAVSHIRFEGCHYRKDIAQRVTA